MGNTSDTDLLRYALFSMSVPSEQPSGEISWHMIGASVIKIKSIVVQHNDRGSTTRVEFAGYRENITWEFDNNALIRHATDALREMRQVGAVEHDEQARKTAFSKISGRNFALAAMLEREFADREEAEDVARIWVVRNGGQLFIYRASDTTYGIDTRDSDLRVGIIE